MIITIILLVLAVYRLAYMTSTDTGPFAVFDKLRLFALRFVKDADRQAWIIEGVHCPMCHSVWYSALAAIAMRPPTVEMFITYWLGIAGGVLVLIQILMMRDRK